MSTRVYTYLSVSARIRLRVWDRDREIFKIPLLDQLSFTVKSRYRDRRSIRLFSSNRKSASNCNCSQTWTDVRTLLDTATKTSSTCGGNTFPFTVGP